MNDYKKGARKEPVVPPMPDPRVPDPQQSERNALYLEEQIALAAAQREQLKRDQELHDLHKENLKLQSHTLRAQHSQLHTQRLHDRIRTVYQSALSLVALLVLALIAYGVYSAATDQSVVVNEFQVPPSFAAVGDNGTVIASEFLDRLQALQASVRSSQASRTLEDAWSNNIQLQVPDVHVSLGEIRRTLHQWLGHEIQINGDLIEQGNQIDFTVRGTGFAAKTFTGPLNTLPTLINNAADYVYGQAEPYLYADHLIDNGQYAQTLQFVQEVFPTALAKEKPWLLQAWGNGLADQNQNVASADKFREAIRLDPHFSYAYAGLEDEQILLGEEESAYQTGSALERATHRGSWFAARAAPVQYVAQDYLRRDLPAVHLDLQQDEAAFGGQGSQGDQQDAPQDAEILVRMHDFKPATQILQTSPGAGTDPYALVETAFVQGLMALDQQNYAQAVTEIQTTLIIITQHPDQQANFLTPPSCYLGLALEFAGQPTTADTAIAQGGHFVDCYRFKGDIADHRGNWTQAQQDYQAAVNLAPSLPMAYESWGEVLFRHGDFKDAILQFEQANQRGPHWCDPLEHWGEALAAEGNYRTAIQKYAAAAQYTPGWGALELHWGQALDKLDEHSRALTHYQVAQQHDASLTAAEHATLAKLLNQT